MNSPSLLRPILTCLLVVSLFSAAPAAVPNLSLEASLSGGSTSNLFSDSSARYSQFRGVSLDVNYSLFSFAQVNLAGEYTYYRQLSSLSNLRYGGGVTLIPLSDSSRFRLFLTSNVYDRRYREIGLDSAAINANEFTGREYDGMVAVGYDLTATVQLRSSISFSSLGYDIDGVNDKEAVDAAVGGNLTLLNRFSLDVELGYSTGRYQYINPVGTTPRGNEFDRNGISPGEQYDILVEDRLKSIYFSPRLSTGLGRMTGVSLTYSVRNYQDHDETQTVYGYSSGWLSPWNTSYDGQAVVLNLKTYLIPRLIVSITTGYWDKEYLRVVEDGIWHTAQGFPQPGVGLENARDRTDYRSRTSITLQMPLSHASGYFLEPTLTLDYTDNKSTVPVYDYTSFSVMGGLTVRF